MPERKPPYVVTPQMHALMRAQRVSAYKAERAEKRERVRRDFEREQGEAFLHRYGLSRDDPRWPLVQRAIFAAVDNGMDFRNDTACRRVAGKVLDDLARKQSREETDVVYYLRQGDHIKIGTTRNLSQRLRQYPPGTELLATETGSYEREKLRLQQFAAYLVARNEWFSAGPELMAHIDALRQRAA